MSELASSLSWAVTTAARRHGVVIDSVRLNTAITQAMVKNGMAGIDINSLCAALSLPKSQRLPKPDRAQLPMLGVVGDRGWGVIVDQRPDGRWIFISEEGHALVSDSELGEGAYKLDFAALGNKPDQHGFERVFKEALAEYRPIILEVVIASVVMSVIALGASIFSMQVYDRVIPTHGVATLIVLAIGVSLAILFELGMKFARSHIMDSVVSGLDAKLSQALFERLLSVRVDQLPGSVGSLAGQLRGYEQIRSFYTSQTLFTLVDLPLGLLFVLVIAFIASPWMALVPTVFGLAAIGIGYLSNRKVVRLADKSAAASNLKTGLLVETVEGVETIKSGSGGWKFLSRWIDVSAESIRSDMAMRAIGDHAGYIAAMLQQLSYSTTVIVGSFLVINGQITMGALIACSILGGRILAPVAMIPGLMVQRAHTKATLAGLEKIYALQTDQGNERQLTPDTGTSVWNWSYTLTAADWQALGADGVNGVEKIIGIQSHNTVKGLDSIRVTHSVMIDTTPPVFTAQLALASDTGTPGDGITSVGKVLVSGLEAAARWAYKIDGGDYQPGSGGSFTIAGDGAHTVKVRQTDRAGNDSAEQVLTMILDTAAPAKLSATLARDTGSSGLDRLTNDGTLNVSGVESGASWQYSLDSGVTWSNGSGGSFNIKGVADGAGNVDGAKKVVVRQTDVAGNVGANSAAVSFTLDTTLPAKPTLALAKDSGNTSDRITNEGTVNVSKLESGASWQYSLDNGTTWQDGTAASFRFAGTADDGGGSDGAKNMLVRQTDAAGNVSPNSDKFSFTLDTTAPAAPALALSVDSGNPTDKITNNATFKVSGVEAGASWQYSLDSGTTWSNGSGTSVKLSGLPDGNKTMIVRQIDVAGNVGNSSDAVSITLDTAAPANPGNTHTIFGV
ncbi:Ig-like domain-containing protein [Herbaspirillum huttiense]|uniref:Ig-like domain-containing protein n=1 Tax=Herbaspirillum huttiense TaxID=863372 RepID=UPI0039B0051C